MIGIVFVQKVLFIRIGTDCNAMERIATLHDYVVILRLPYR